MSLRATKISSDPLNFFHQHNGKDAPLRVSDVILRSNEDPKELFARIIRFASQSQWSHSALIYLVNDPAQGFDNIFVVEAMPRGIHIASWQKEITPPQHFNVGIRRLPLDWYVEPPAEASKHDRDDPEDTHGIAYLRHVRAVALDQINNLYDRTAVQELAAQYVERLARKHLPAFPGIANVADALSHFFEKQDEAGMASKNIMRFMCSGLVQYSFFAALQRRIASDLQIPAHRDAAMSNLSNLHRIIFREDPDGIVPEYIQQVQSGKLKITDPLPENLENLLRTALPADFNNSKNLTWCYVAHEGTVWRIDEDAPATEAPDEEEQKVLKLIALEAQQ